MQCNIRRHWQYTGHAAHHHRPAVCRPFVYRPAVAQDIGAESFVVHDPTTTQRKRNDATRRRDDKLVTIVARWRRERFVRFHSPVRYDDDAHSATCSSSFFTSDDHFSPDTAVDWLLLSSVHALYVYQLSVISWPRFSALNKLHFVKLSSDRWYSCTFLSLLLGAETICMPIIYYWSLVLILFLSHKLKITSKKSV